MAVSFEHNHSVLVILVRILSWSKVVYMQAVGGLAADAVSESARVKPVQATHSTFSFRARFAKTITELTIEIANALLDCS
jgi:hypothetical protein